MKPIYCFGILLVATSVQAQTMNPATMNTVALPASTPYAVVSRDANSALWQWTTYEQAPNGKAIPHVHRYVELSSGLNHLANGQYAPSSENIFVSPDGNSASATNGQHQVYFPGNIYGGAIRLVTPDGKVLQSQPTGLALSDGNTSVLLAVVTNATGALLPSGNQVIYQNAFAGLNADLVFSYTKAGLEQDVVLHMQPSEPAALGLNPEKTRLQMITEFIASPQPDITATTVPTDAGNLEDDSLSFGAMQMAQGRAFLLGTNSLSVGVEKRWLTMNGRQFLIEEVPMVSIAREIKSLPPYASQAETSAGFAISKNLALPPERSTKIRLETIFTTKAPTPTQGLILDYVILNSDTNNFTFQGDTTYYLSGSLNLSGATTNTFEGGVVIKYAPGCHLWLLTTYMTLNWQASVYRPVIFTAMDDNSAGETITNSTGHPTNCYANPALLFSSGGGNVRTNTLRDVRIAHASVGIQTSYSPLVIRDSQFVNVSNAVKTTGNSLNLENVLMYNVSGTALYAFGTGANCVAQNLTVHNANTFFTQGAWSTLALTNSLLVACTNGCSGFTGAYNYTNGSDAGIFQTVVAGANYLATNCPAGILAASTTNIDPALLGDLQTKTVWPPQMVYSNVTITNNLNNGSDRSAGHWCHADLGLSL